MMQSAVGHVDGGVVPAATRRYVDSVNAAARESASEAAGDAGVADVACPIVDGAEARRVRGRNRAPAWRRPAEGPVTVVRLRLTPDPAARHRLEGLFGAAWSLKRALRRDARSRALAYRAGHRRRRTQAEAKRWRVRLGLSREALERAGYRHLDASGHLRHHLSKAVAMHLADEVWSGLERHLFADASGRRQGVPKVGSWWEFSRIPGRARSHTKSRKWETFRLHGTLAGHLAAYPVSGLPGGSSPEAAAALPPGTGVLAQPRTMAVPSAPRSRGGKGVWWEYEGPLALVYAGGPDGCRGDLVVPVRLPQGAGQWPHLLHTLADPEVFHKVDLVRRRDPAEPGGWCYEAHLMVLKPAFVPASTAARRAKAPAGRRGGVDGNVSNLAAVSAPIERADAAAASPQTALDSSGVISSKVTMSPDERARIARRARKRRGRQRALERSRRASNTAQYEPSRRQRKRQRRRQAAGLPPKQAAVPGGPRVARADGRPRRSYGRDALSGSYRRLRAREAAAAHRTAQSRKTRARHTAGQIVAVHGPHLVIEDCDIRAWFRLWGRACARFTPGMLITALDHECRATGGRLLRAAISITALSQHCPCGRRVPKHLGVRTHHCRTADGGCGLTGDRDLVSAALAAFTHLTDPDDPSTARVDYQTSRRVLCAGGPGLPGALTESTAPIPAPGTGAPAGAGTGNAAATPPQPRRRRPRRRNRRAASARRTRTGTAPTPDEPPLPTTPAGGTAVTPDRRRPRTRLSKQPDHGTC
ncbi:transposase [Actinomadura sp. 7K507]|uniref:transposase n=1 Tax=Actinomadura sp. 7K507 TaxID=2530365 RepID=UPI001047B797|nr:transposase [Actinomadura sp. 7K507]TDC81369.1 transposase [Actinomadura sp. 7K507]